jgi:hypothetical protein
MNLPYSEFGRWILNDLATRTTENGIVIFAGNHICIRNSPPTRAEGETNEQFAFQMDQFRKNLRRGSDASERLALAAKAFMLAGETNWFAAAHSVLKLVRSLPSEKKAEYESQGIGYAFRPIDMPVGTTRRNRRTKEKKQNKTVEELQADSIRAQVSRFINNHPDFERLFERHFGEFRFRFCREAWFASVEASYMARIESFERSSEPFDWYSAMPLAVCAQFYHEQRRYTPALLHYRKAIRAARRAVMHEDLRAFVLQWLRRGVKLCNHSTKMIPMPPYSGPWLPASGPE